MKRSKLVVAVCVLCVVIASGCKSNKKEVPVPAAAPQAQPAANMPQPPAISLSGKVVETMNSGGYTYVSVENGGKKTWVALPATAVKVGQRGGVSARHGDEEFHEQDIESYVRRASSSPVVSSLIPEYPGR